LAHVQIRFSIGTQVLKTSLLNFTGLLFGLGGLIATLQTAQSGEIHAEVEALRAVIAEARKSVPLQDRFVRFLPRVGQSRSMSEFCDAPADDGSADLAELRPGCPGYEVRGTTDFQDALPVSYHRP
jgi:hypothetical protein